MRWLTRGRVLDVATGEWQRAGLGIDGERIAVVDDDTVGRPVGGDEIIDVDGCWLVPGLIDAHVHLTSTTDDADPASMARRTDAEVALHTAWAAEQALLAGVTTVRDVGGWNYVEMAVRDAVRAGRVRGPRMFLAGRLLSITTSTVAIYPGMYEVADGADAVRRAARQQLAHGADLIKVMATGAMLSSESEDARAIQFTLDELRAAVEIAHDNHKHVAAHAHALAGIENCIAAGVDSIEHGSFADDAVLAKMAAAGTYLVPTICAGELLFRDEGVMAAMPEYLRERMVGFHAQHVDAVRRAHVAGVRIAMGTDAGTPGNHHGMNANEVAFLVDRCGLAPIEAVRSATTHGAALLGRRGELGCLAPDAFADVLVCAADPLADLTELTRPVMVMKGGQVVRDDRS